MAVPYADIDDFSSCFDTRALRELASDDGTDATLSGNTLLTEMLTQASYEIQSFVLRGNVYSADELDDLASAPDSLLVRLTCVIAAKMLLTRRLGAIPPSLEDEVRKANSTLADLRDGKLVFGVLASQKAEANNPTVSFVSSAQRPLLRMTADSEFFPTRITSAS